VHSLKKVARLPSKDRSAVLQILKRKVHKHQGFDQMNKVVEVFSQSVSEEASSSCSVNNDWKHWMVMQGSERYW